MVEASVLTRVVATSTYPAAHRSRNSAIESAWDCGRERVRRQQPLDRVGHPGRRDAKPSATAPRHGVVGRRCRAAVDGEREQPAPTK